MNFKKTTMTPLSIKTMKDSLPDYISNIEYDGAANYRVTFNGSELQGLLIPKDDKYVAIHYCESNEHGSTCSHLTMFGAIADQIGGEMDKAAFKVSVKEMTELLERVESPNFYNVNTYFGLLEPYVETVISEEEISGAPVASAPAPSPIADKRDWTIGWGDIQAYLRSERCSVDLINRLRTRRETIHETVSCLPMMIAPKKPDFPYSGDVLARALRHIALGKDLILVGGKGTGKDTLINTISWILGLPVSIHVGNKDETKESIVGEPAFRDGQSTFDLSQFAQTVQNGGLANMAEINMLLGDVTSVYHSLLDENRVLASPVGAVARHPYFIMIGSMNVGEGYVGVRALNDAFKDRFSIIRLPYTQEFKEMISQKTSLHDTHALDFLEKVKNAVEKLIKENNQGHAASTIRGYIDAARYFLEYAVTVDTKTEVIEDFVLNKVEDLDEYMALRHMIREDAWPGFPISKEEQEYMDGGF
ncbi:AAA family ATPase [Psychrobacillus sp. FSL H8-0484]|uniref:AAA family ATPase n=1 Tax=Psychrobacillus sp. FSL H8-0484 TaxID=2921390 RepID=UPI0030F95DA0